MSTLVAIVLALLALAVGVVIGVIFHRQSESKRLGTAQAQADKLIKSAESDAESISRNAEIEAKEILFKARSEAERETRDRIAELQKQQERLLKREENLERKGDQLATRESDLDRMDRDLSKREKAAETSARQSQDLLAQASAKLESMAAMSREQARQMLVDQVTEEARRCRGSPTKCG